MVIQDISRGAGKYEIVYTDPPWEQARGGRKPFDRIQAENPLIITQCRLRILKNSTNASCRITPKKNTMSLCGV